MPIEKKTAQKIHDKVSKAGALLCEAQLLASLNNCADLASLVNEAHDPQTRALHRIEYWIRDNVK